MLHVHGSLTTEMPVLGSSLTSLSTVVKTASQKSLGISDVDE